MKKSQAYISLALTLSIFGVAGVYAQQASKSAAPSTGSVSVNGVTIPKSRIDMMVKAQTAQGRPESPELLAMVKNQFVLMEILSQEAAKKGIDKNADVATRISIGRQQVLADAYLQDYVKTHPISDADLKKEYETYKSVRGDKEYKPRHILVKTEEEAKAIIEQLNKGGDFAKIAKEKSEDPGSKDNGGDLDWVSPDRFVPPFAEALKTLSKGQTTQKPVQTNFGFHVIKVDDVRELKAPSFDEVKDSLRNQLQDQQVKKLIADLRSKAKVVEK